MCHKIFASVDGGLSGGSCVRRPGNEDPHQRYRKFFPIANTKSLWKGNVYKVYFPTNTKVINVNLYFAKNICWDILHLRINQIIKKQLYNYPVNRCVNNNYFQ